MQRAVKIGAVASSLAVGIVTILLNNDPDELRERSCFATFENLWFCGESENAAQNSALSLNKPSDADETSSIEFTNPAQGRASASADPTSRPNITVAGHIGIRYGNTVDVLVRIKVENPTDQPMQVAWSRIRSNAQVTLADGTTFKPTRASEKQPVGIDDCRWDAQICWQKYRGAFTEIQPHEVTTGTLTFSTDLPTQDIRDAVASNSFDFTAPLIFGAPDSAVADVANVSLTEQSLSR